MLKITLTKSTIACKKDQIATVQALGLKKMHSTVVKEDNVKHLVTVEEVD